MRKALLFTTALFSVHGAFAATACSTTAPAYAATSGGFGVLNGQIYAPDGSVFVPRGVNVSEWNEPSASEILTKFPGTNFVRLAIFDYASPASLKPYIDDLTSHGIFVELEDHTDSTGTNSGGSWGSIFTGQQLSTELAWYSSVASAFKNNPYVGFGTDNEPSETNANGTADPAALSDWQLQTYKAIRDTGNNGMIWLEMNGWKTADSYGAGYKASDYKGMTNVAWDMHPYPNTFDANASVSQDAAAVAQRVAAAQQIKSADGTMAVSFLEDGNSTDGVNIDRNWQTALQAVQNSGYGSVAWLWGSGNPGDGLLSDSFYASQVANYIAGSGSVGCTFLPPSQPANAPTSVAAGNTALAAANTLSVADVASMAAQGLDANGNQVSSPVQLASIASNPLSATDVSMSASGVGSAGTLSISDIAALSSGNVINIAPVQRTQSSPGGIMPTPDPVADGPSWSASGNYTTVIPTSGNTTGVVTGVGNTINATGGIQTISVTGPGNSITTGPYNDVVSVQSAGNTINLGGGQDTLNLDYHGQLPSTIINADAAAIPPLASAGNIIVLPPPGTGMLTINGVMAANDRLDVTKALAGTTWNGSALTIWNYVEAAATPQGCVISVNGKAIAVLPNGSPGGQLGSFIAAVH